MKHIVLKVLAAASVLALGASLAQAQTPQAEAKLQVQIQIVTGCTVNFPLNSGNVNFGQYSAISSDLIETQKVVVDCNKGTAPAGGTVGEPVQYTLSLDEGKHSSDGTPATRRLAYNTNFINYNVYQAVNQSSRNCGGTIWGKESGQSFTGALGSDASGVNGSSTHYFTVCIPAQATPALGTYTDSLTATLSY